MDTLEQNCLFLHNWMFLESFVSQILKIQGASFSSYLAFKGVPINLHKAIWRDIR